MGRRVCTHRRDSALGVNSKSHSIRMPFSEVGMGSLEVGADSISSSIHISRAHTSCLLSPISSSAESTTSRQLLPPKSVVCR